MPGSFLARHRTICEVLEEIRTFEKFINSPYVRSELDNLVNEAKDYAQRMSAKLTEYKLNKEQNK